MKLNEKNELIIMLICTITIALLITAYILFNTMDPVDNGFKTRDSVGISSVISLFMLPFFGAILIIRLAIVWTVAIVVICIISKKINSINKIVVKKVEKIEQTNENINANDK